MNNDASELTPTVPKPKYTICPPVLMITSGARVYTRRCRLKQSNNDPSSHAYINQITTFKTKVIKKETIENT